MENLPEGKKMVQAAQIKNGREDVLSIRIMWIFPENGHKFIIIYIENVVFRQKIQKRG